VKNPLDRVSWKTLFIALGGSWQSQGTLATDRRFTGQRLDSTGLYYDNARYYDPVIGRFISADTVVQSFSNPQTLNRYSYCVNNPLKYTDPSGSEFDAGAHQQDIDDAYDSIMNSPNVPQWIKSYMETLHDSKRAVSVYFADVQGEAVGISAMNLYVLGIIPYPAQKFSAFGIDIDTSLDTIILDNSYLNSSAGLAAGFAHECYHIYEAHLGATIEEEWTAYEAEYEVGLALGWSGITDPSISWVPNSYGWQGFGSKSNDWLKLVKTQLTSGSSNASKVYAVMPLRQSQMNTSLALDQAKAAYPGIQTPWYTIFVSARGKRWK
jgi:RHS repeat-associated protein